MRFVRSRVAPGRSFRRCHFWSNYLFAI